MSNIIDATMRKLAWVHCNITGRFRGQGIRGSHPYSNQGPEGRFLPNHYHKLLYNF